MAAKKALTGYARKFQDINKKPMDPKQEKRLDRLTNVKTIRFEDLPASITKEFPAGPGGVLKRKTLKEIEELCK